MISGKKPFLGVHGNWATSLGIKVGDILRIVRGSKETLSAGQEEISALFLIKAQYDSGEEGVAGRRMVALKEGHVLLVLEPVAKSRAEKIVAAAAIYMTAQARVRLAFARYDAEVEPKTGLLFDEWTREELRAEEARAKLCRLLFSTPDAPIPDPIGLEPVDYPF